MRLYPLVRPLAFSLDAERAHQLTIRLLRAQGDRGSRATKRNSRLETRVAGLTFPNPVGLAAGFDKNAEVIGPMLGLGFGSVEVGTLTPLPQPGNAKPRMFRLIEDRAVINRLGFNNRGHADALKRLSRRRAQGGVVGVNVGANKDSADRVQDYVEGVRAFSSAADYLTVNISSPNTPGLRGLQDAGELDALLAAVRSARQPAGPPLFLKVAPDLAPGDPERIVRAAVDHAVDGIIVSNTTVSRPPLRSSLAGEAGGLSGAPLKALSLQALREFRSAAGGQVPLIGVGGIGDAEDAWERIRAGANLVQLYSAMVYEGPGIARRIVRGLEQHLKREGFSNIAEAVGTE